MKRTLSALVIGLIVALAATAMHVAIADSEDEGLKDARTETVNLHPGDNFVGWVAEPTSIEDFFSAIPSAVLVFRWDADVRSWRYAIREVGGNLDVLEPGMATMIRIGGADSVQWQRPLTPAKGMVTLYSGENWVAWNGRDEWPLEQVARGIGTSLVRIDVEELGIVYQPGDDLNEGIVPFNEATKIRRGDALRVTVNRELRWLQPTYMMPEVVFPGGASEELRSSISNDVHAVLDYYTTQFGIQADPSQYRIVIPDSLSSLISFYETEQHSYVSTDILKSVWSGGGFVIRGDLVVNRSNWENSDSDESWVLAHEYFHILQGQLGWVHGPFWVTEGPATLAHMRYAFFRKHGITSDAAGEESFAKHMELTAWNAHCGHLADPEDWSYSDSAVVMHLLTQRAGTTATIELNRHSYAMAGQSWEEVFAQTLGHSVEKVYKAAGSWYRSAAERHLGHALPEPITVSGNVRWSDGVAVSDLKLDVSYYPAEGTSCYGGDVAQTASDGSFRLRMFPETSGKISLNFQQTPWNCGWTQWGGGGLFRIPDKAAWNTAADHASILVGELEDDMLDVLLPDDYCRYELEGRVIDAAERGVPGAMVFLWPERQPGDVYVGSITQYTSQDGSFSVRLPRTTDVHWRISVGDSCVFDVDAGMGSTWVKEGISVVQRDDTPPRHVNKRVLVDFPRADMRGVEVALPVVDASQC